MAEVRCRNVGSFEGNGWDNDERRLDDLIIPSSSSRQEAKQTKSCF